MATAENLLTGKNALWLEYKMAHPLVRDKILIELKEKKLDRYWQDVASKEGYDLPNAKGRLIKIFLKHMPESAHFFEEEEEEPVNQA